MPLLKGKKNIGRNIKTEMNAGKRQKQAVAIAEKVSRKSSTSRGLKSAKRTLRAQTDGWNDA